MITICTLADIFPAMEFATDEEVPLMRDGMKMISESAMTAPLMDLEYALNEEAREIVERYVSLP